MTIQPITNYSKNNNYINFNSKKHNNSRQNDNTQSMKTKAGTAMTSILGVGAAVALIAKRQGFSLSPSRIAKTPVKDWAIFKITDKKRPDEVVMKFKAPEILTMGIGSVLGGLIGGAIFDKKENFPAKCSEAVSQFVGDISIPLMFVAGPTALYKKFEDLSTKETKHIGLQKASKFINGNKILRVLCPTIVSGASLATGIIAGNKVSNKINEKVHGVKQDRGIRLTDFAPHLDDVCLAITLMADKSPVGDIISKLVPIALTIAGIETGTATKDKR